MKEKKIRTKLAFWYFVLYDISLEELTIQYWWTMPCCRCCYAHDKVTISDQQFM